MKNYSYEIYIKLNPNLLGQKNNKKENTLFINAINKEWNLIPQKIIDNCILSLPRRWEAVIKANGYYTKY